MNNNIIGFPFFIANAKTKISQTREFGASVHPKYQRLGIGQLLTEALLKWATALAVTSVQSAIS